MTVTETAPTVAVVTGAASGLGMGLSIALLERGWCVTLVDIDSEALDAAVYSLGSTYRGRVLGRPADVSDREAIKRVKTAAEATFGPVDLLCNNAGVAPPASRVVDTPPSVWDWAYSVNVEGAVNGIRTFVPAMVERGTGIVVNSASVMGLAPGHLAAPYSASKAALVSLSIALREELKGTGVAVALAFPHVASAISRSRDHWLTRLGPPPWPTEGRSSDPELAASDDAAESYVAEGLSPVEAGKAVLAGVEAGRFWIAAGAGLSLFSSRLSPSWPDLDAPSRLD